ncbi:MAG: 50S ribosomal protein L10 [Anaerolineae bacterium]|nr:50S ribosomal protein L10 [Anaerolineae bacterium]
MATTKQKKSEMYSSYLETLDGAQGMIVTEYRGMRMKAINAVRAAARQAGGSYNVVKSTIFQIALREKGFAVPEDLLKGPVAVAVTPADLPKLTKVMLGIKDVPELILKGAIMGESVFMAEQLEALSTLPTLDEARASLLGTLNSAASQLVGLLAQPAQGLAGTLKAYTDKQQEGEGAPA